MTFERQPCESWPKKIPGARWYKVDLHVHTIDDYAGGRVVMPDGLSGDPQDPQVLSRYARCFLQNAVANGVQVIGLTPHSPRVGAGPDTSAVWKIVEEWNSGQDDDGVPFREKVFAVFPGFEPNLNDGSNGVHVLLLFDPEIGRDRYLGLFDAIMDGRPPWDMRRLLLTPRSAKDVFNTLEKSQSESDRSDSPWRYIALAPHFQGDHGLFKSMRKEVLDRFPCFHLAGYELGDEKLVEDLRSTEKPGSYLLPYMAKHHQAFFHGSDAYSIEDIGRRHTWMKLATPRIEALRQAFVASDSRMRIGFIRDGDGELTTLPNPPDVTMDNRSWLKSVTVRSHSSFFGPGKSADEPQQTRFDFSPDLTCVIGGSMTGKSTLLDGLRTYVGAPDPDDELIREHVRQRGKNRFLLGSKEIELEVPGSDLAASPHDRWPARFFTQSELQRLADAGSIEQLLARFVPDEALEIEDRKLNLEGLDKQISESARGLVDLDEKLAVAEEDLFRADQAKRDLDAFEGAGVSKLLGLGRQRQTWSGASNDGNETGEAIDTALDSARSLSFPEIDDEMKRTLSESGVEPKEIDLDAKLQGVIKKLESARNEFKSWLDTVVEIVDKLQDSESVVRKEVERAMEKQGIEASRIVEFQKLHQRAALLGDYKANFEEITGRVKSAELSMELLLKERRELVEEQRRAYDRVLAHVAQQFGERIRARRINHGDSRPLGTFLTSFAQTGVTRWWKGLESLDRPSPDRLIESLESNTLSTNNMTPVVQRSFKELMTRAKRRELAAIRNPDVYLLEMRLDDGNYRGLDQLSGGQRVSILLSLLLETADNRPLVIDQPEDEIDNRFLWETILPALKKLKGQRQIIVATHNPNIVVNGDADMVIRLEATANRGWIAESGAIEEPSVRDAIVRTVDGGDEAFRLRRQKYGF